MTNFEIEILTIIAKWHPYPLEEIQNVYLKIKHFDKLIEIINFATQCNRTLSYMTNLFIELTARAYSASEWVNWAIREDKLKDTIEETVRQKY